MKKIIITADLGHLKAYMVAKEGPGPGSPSVELITSFDSIESHGKRMDKLSDAAGNFRRGNGGGKGASVSGGGSGERHGMAAEIKRKSLKRLAEEVNRIIEQEKCEGWYLAAASTINAPLVEGLRPEVKGKLLKNLKSDLVNESKAGLLGRFAEQEA